MTPRGRLTSINSLCRRLRRYRRLVQTRHMRRIGMSRLNIVLSVYSMRGRSVGKRLSRSLFPSRYRHNRKGWGRCLPSNHAKAVKVTGVVRGHVSGAERVREGEHHFTTSKGFYEFGTAKVGKK
jgi:hypothetical protein